MFPAQDEVGVGQGVLREFLTVILDVLSNLGLWKTTKDNLSYPADNDPSMERYYSLYGRLTALALMHR